MINKIKILQNKKMKRIIIKRIFRINIKRKMKEKIKILTLMNPKTG